MQTLTYRYITNWEDLEEAAAFLNAYVEESPNPILALDFETYSIFPLRDKEVPRPVKGTLGYRGFPKTIQIGIAQDIQFVIDVELLKDYKRVGNTLRNCLENSIVIGQNLKYEYQFCYVFLGLKLGKMRDTMLISQVLNAGDKESKASLDELYAQYLWTDQSSQLFELQTGMTFKQYSEFKKRMQKSTWRGTLEADQIRYAADDVKYIFPLYDEILARVDSYVEGYEKNNKPNKTILNPMILECNCIPVYAMMELRGIKFNLDYHLRFVVPFLEVRAKSANYDVGRIFTHKVKKSNGERGKKRIAWEEDEPINLNSPAQIKKALASVGVNIPDTKEETLEEFMDAHESVPLILQYKKANSKLTKYGYKMKEFCNSKGIIYPNWFQIGRDDGTIATGRSSCKDPPLQTIPNKESDIFGKSASELFRKSYIARDGNILIDADLSQIEARLEAEICKEKDLIKAFVNKEDLHKVTAKKVLDIAGDPTKEERDIGKTLRYMIGYGAGYKKLALAINKSPEEAKQIIFNYYDKQPGVRKLKQTLERDSRKKAEVYGTLAAFKRKSDGTRPPIYILQNEYGRIRRWNLTKKQEDFAKTNPGELLKSANNGRYNEFENRMNNISREAYNFCFQSLNADLLKIAALNIHNEFNAAGFDEMEEGIIALVHDEVLCEVKKEHEEQAKEIITRCMIEAAEMFLTQIPAVVNVMSGEDWSSCH